MGTRALADILSSRREEHGFLLTAWVFLPNHWHAILFPRAPLTVSRVMESVKVSSTLRINRERDEKETLWQSRFFDQALRTVKEYGETIEYIHWNPVKAGLVSRPKDWRWSSALDYTTNVDQPCEAARILLIDRIVLPADEKTRI
ncbi:MAG: REP-associated tyrosine transposase [Candidatus Acidiferrales bacterium]